MNILLTELGNKKQLKACDIEDPDIKAEMNSKFGQDLYQNISDIYGKENSQRQYYTTPVTTNVNNQTDFAKWLYFGPDTCKEGNGNQCIANINSPFLADTPFKFRYQ